MKKNCQFIKAGLSGALLLALTGLWVCADDWANNTASMVTYFPVPYAAYNNIYVSEKFDVGASPNSFTLDLGASSGMATGQPAMEVENMTLRRNSAPGATQPALTMNSDVYTPEANFGNTHPDRAAVMPSEVEVSFGTLRIGQAADSLNIDSLEAGHFDVDSLSLFGANLGEARCTNPIKGQNATVQTVNIDFDGSGLKTYVVCCDKTNDSTGGSCNTQCYFADTVQNRTRASNCTTTDGIHPIGTWVQDRSPAPNCGCNCPSHASLQTNGYCQCQDAYTYIAPSCVLKCSLDDYRSENKGECCASYSGSNYSDTVCWALQWQDVETSVERCMTPADGESCGGLAAMGGLYENSSYDGQEAGNACSVSNDTFKRRFYTGNSCSFDANQCAYHIHTYRCNYVKSGWN